MEIKFNTVGELLAGHQAGWFVKVEDDRQESGGYLILTAKAPDMKDGFDNWVEDEDSLRQFFIEVKWSVRWLKSHPA